MSAPPKKNGKEALAGFERGPLRIEEERLEALPGFESSVPL